MTESTQACGHGSRRAGPSSPPPAMTSTRTRSSARRGYAEVFGKLGQLRSDAGLVHVVSRRHAHLVHLQRHGSFQPRASPWLGTQTSCCSRVLTTAETAQPLEEFEWGMNRHPPRRRAARRRRRRSAAVFAGRGCGDHRFSTDQRVMLAQRIFAVQKGAPGRIRTCDTRFRKCLNGPCRVGDVRFPWCRNGREWLHWRLRAPVRSTNGSTGWAGRESMAQHQVPSSVSPSCSAKSLKSLTFKVARGRS
jgi:hypothetical protein